MGHWFGKKQLPNRNQSFRFTRRTRSQLNRRPAMVSTFSFTLLRLESWLEWIWTATLFGRKDIGAFPTGNGFGPGSSITVGDGRVYVQCDNDQSSFVAAYDTKTGEEVWNKPREGRTSWSTPVFWKNDIRSELVTCGSGFVTSYNPANGEQYWSLSNIGMSFSSSPAFDSERLYFGNSGPRSSGPLVAVAAGMNGQA